MKGFPKFICLVLAISLSISVIWPVPASEAATTQVVFLEKISSGMAAPGAVDLDAQGNLLVADAYRGVLKYNKLGTLIATSAVVPSGAGLAFNPKNGKVYVADGDKVLVLNAALEQVDLLGDGAGEFGIAADIDVDDLTGNILVLDNGVKQVKTYGLAHTSVAAFVVPEIDFSSPAGLAIDQATRELYIGFNQGVRQVRVYTQGGGFLRALLSGGSYDPQTMNFVPDGPFVSHVYSHAGIAFSAANSQGVSRGFFTDPILNSVGVVGLPATPDMTYVGSTTEPLTLPQDVVFDDATSRLFVSAGDGVSVLGIDSYTQPTNGAPTVPVPLSPIGASEVTSQPVLSYQASLDPENDPISYEVEVTRAAIQVVSATGVAATDYAVSAPLNENLCYDWRVRASDGVELSAWSAVQSFCVNALSEAPGAPLLNNYLAGDAAQRSAVLQWTAAADADPNDSVSYVVEIAAAGDFAASTLSASVAEISATLGSLPFAGLLSPGAAYAWRVQAVDQQSNRTVSSNTGSLVYAGTRLAVAANMPGAKVYLDGDQSYAGQYLGEAPVELLDLAPGDYSIVVERAGFESFVAPVSLAAGDSKDLHADLLPAVLPELHAARKGGLRYYGSRRLMEVNYRGEQVAPVMTDLNNDGILDLLVMGQTGWLHFYQGVSDTSGVVFKDRAVLLGASNVGSTPFVVDWDNDGLKDLLVGSFDGTVSVLINSGSKTAPAYHANSASYLQLGSAPLAVAGNSVPAVADLNGDFIKDLIVGSADGQVVVFLNTGSDAAPSFASAQLLLTAAGAVAPVAADWNADGLCDLLLSENGQIQLALNNGSGFDTPVTVLTTDKGVRISALDVDKQGGKDFIAGDLNGQVCYLESRGSTMLPSFGAALGDKVVQIADLTADMGALITNQVAQLSGMITQDNGAALLLAEAIALDVPANSAAAVAVNELVTLLQ